MYSQCSNCQAIFNVSESDLGAHRGLVRCGHCGTVFNALTNQVGDDRLPADDKAPGASGNDAPTTPGRTDAARTTPVGDAAAGAGSKEYAARRDGDPGGHAGVRESRQRQAPAPAQEAPPNGSQARMGPDPPDAGEPETRTEPDLPTSRETGAPPPAEPVPDETPGRPRQPVEYPGAESARKRPAAEAPREAPRQQEQPREDRPRTETTEAKTRQAEKPLTDRTQAEKFEAGETEAGKTEAGKSREASLQEEPLPEETGREQPSQEQPSPETPAAEKHSREARDEYSPGEAPPNAQRPEALQSEEQPPEELPSEARLQEADIELPGEITEEITIEAPPVLWNVFDDETDESFWSTDDTSAKDTAEEKRAQSDEAGHGEGARRAPARSPYRSRDITMVELPQPRPFKTASLSLLAVLLALLAVWQVKAFYLDELAQVPVLRPYLERLCRPLGCILPPRRDFAQIDLMGTSIDVNPSFPGALDITASLMNRAHFPQPYPPLRVTLTDREGRVVGRRTYLPAEYRQGDEATLLPIREVRDVSIKLAQPAENVVGYEVELMPPVQSDAG